MPDTRGNGSSFVDWFPWLRKGRDVELPAEGPRDPRLPPPPAPPAGARGAAEGTKILQEQAGKAGEGFKVLREKGIF